MRKVRGHSHNQGTDENSSNIKIKSEESQFSPNEMGRFPANLVLSPYASKLMDEPEGASRFFFRFEEREEMIDYLKKLIFC